MGLKIVVKIIEYALHAAELGQIIDVHYSDAVCLLK